MWLDWIKSALSQIMLAAIVLGVFILVWATQVPSARPMLERTGLADLLGLPPAEAAESGAGARRFGGGGASRVVTAPVGTGALNDRITAIGDGRALRSVSVRAETSGRITEIGFGAGEMVEEGTILFHLDDEAERIALDRARLVLDDAREDADRLDRLRQAGSATAVALREAELALRTAELGVRQAEFDLAQRQVIAPISGWMGLLEYEVGDRVTASEELAVISDRSEIQIDFRVPERVLTKLEPGMKITAQPLALNGVEIAGEVVAIDNMVDRNSRTVRVLGQLANEGDRLRDGMSLSVTMSFEGDPFPTVDPLAVQWSSDGAFVWTVRDGKATRVPIEIRQRNQRTVLVEGALEPGEPVVIEGVQTLRPGAEVSIDRDAAANAPDAAPDAATTRKS
ncbi:multidrug efflux pump, membrane fusion protein (MFP) family protein [Pseudooceanicola batsensis HTCC2597]|uniref:Multidrug efflux pump, membrane fusion protein (MFP) family protein n=1 Tax=Pseudooceanicola batsensis (strain ATCC BAA-863 / DSM 15984 / KCTC 12145 / HTCC2597) TaxID=252305 RepID=A3TUT4_PSEBH|nr:efflux RND transporter periplasmic adaptor subunit [Pseudooceanicola batsensis]EAQ04280.1 multidrug efflux pump, membrane fusion protein (MFP) family protein [Pseudooceanicola batsensis HTCC2597]